MEGEYLKGNYIKEKFMEAVDIRYTGYLSHNDSVGYYFCPKCSYEIISAADVFSEQDIKHKNYCENCGQKLNWSRKDTISAEIDKVKFLNDIFDVPIADIALLTTRQVDEIIEDYVCCCDNFEDTHKLKNKLENWVRCLYG